jgi:serine/threonine protein kinase
MADVVRAHDCVLQRDVAVKLLREGSDVDRERFVSEAHLLAMLNHPNVVTVLDTGIDSEGPWLVLELVDGTPLDELLERGPVDVTRVATIGAQVASALAHAHANGIVHRDVKPSNVLVAADDHVKLTDFGIARRTLSAPLTMTGQTIGTAAYLAPEQVAGESVSTSADVYALGLVLLEALTGRREYDGPAVEAALARLNRSPVVPTSLPPGWPGLISKMTARLPTERPAALDVAARLDVLSGRSPAVAPPLSQATSDLPTNAGRAAGRRRRVLAVIAAVVAGLLVATTLLLNGGPEDGENASAADSGTRASSTRPKPPANPKSPTATPTVARTTESGGMASPAAVESGNRPPRAAKPPTTEQADEGKGKKGADKKRKAKKNKGKGPAKKPGRGRGR